MRPIPSMSSNPSSNVAISDSSWFNMIAAWTASRALMPGVATRRVLARSVSAGVTGRTVGQSYTKRS